MRSQTRAFLALAAAMILGISIVAPRSQTLEVVGIVVATAVAAVAALARDASLPALSQHAMRLMGSLGIAIGAVAFVTLQLDQFDLSHTGRVVALAIPGAALAVGALLLVFGSRTRLGWWLLFSGHAAFVLAVIVWPVAQGAYVDVEPMQRAGIEALLSGMNPYATMIPDPYSPAASALLFADGLSVGGILQFGYPYPPLSLLVIAPFDWVSDFRVASAVAALISALAIADMGRDAVSRRAAATFLLMTPVLGMVRWGWNDLLIMAVAIGIVWLVYRQSRASSWMVGAMLAMKQYSFILVIPSLLILERPWTVKAIVRHFAKAGSVAVAVTIPFFLWGPDAFYRSVVGLHLRQSFRPDAITLPALFPDVYGSLPKVVLIAIPLVVLGVVSVAMLLRTPTGAQGFALGSSLALLATFLVSKQAFGNYYVVALGLLCAAGAAWGSSDRTDPQTVEEETPKGSDGADLSVDSATSLGGSLERSPSED
ncbi:MAG: glycosyltransferase family 87 protein [Acidimicrobiia bacterium]